MWRSIPVLFLFTLALSAPVVAGTVAEQLRVPLGFSIALWAKVDNARQMALGRHGADGGTVYVGSMKAGKVHAVRYDGALRATAVTQIAEGLNLPTGVAWRDGNLYVAAQNRILRYDDIDRHIDRPPAPVVVTDRLPDDRHHGWKFIAFGPDGKLYVPVGAPCNVCAADPDRYALILRMNPDGSEPEVYARGVRNSVGFDWQPGSGALWFTDNGRDWMGDDLPPDELNRAPVAGLHFGFPYCHGGDIADPEFGQQRTCREFEAPAQKLGPHVAALGMRFYTGSMFPPEYRGSVFIAEHGSWNRAHKIGYRVSVVRVDGERARSYEPFAEGWLDGDKVRGRPSDVLVLPDGSLLVADDEAGAIWRITYRR
ncbi:sorbosone dehydrogenase family protein [Dechloromonas sp. XY25]|uniref:Sorbosone dehydrogenase family protein n=1 Tax=Dechloromonas hankyongensis TaxID=2908002 RepID=A0ABS9K611_9RHOO|nr:sorbosone dehydrogenase family protein [Dechloromonas hankyongensis]MCG2578573.1 sorbosone dehydrogenase family protein [Dechloromonas hankyongensis]